jgi:hypothetical protein
VGHYLRRAFTPCLILTAGVFLVRLWLDGWWVERRAGWAIEHAARQPTVQERHRALADVVGILDGYKRHVAGANAVIPNLDTSSIDQLREYIDWYRLETASIYTGHREYDKWSKMLDEALRDYQLQDLGVLRPKQRRVFTVLLWVLAGATGVMFFCKMSWHEWGEV